MLGFSFYICYMDFNIAILFLKNFEERKIAFENRDDILNYGINLLKVSHDVFNYLIILKFNDLSVSQNKLSLEEAVIKAQIIRINHFVHSIVIMEECKSINAETFQIFQRIHFEACINLHY